MPKYVIGSRAFERRKLDEGRESGESTIIVRAMDVEIKSDGERAFDFTISTASVDRYGDTIAVGGWKLENFKKNPVVLWMHDNTRPPIAQAANVRVEGGALKARVVFDAPEIDPFAEQIFQKLKTGTIRATSVGFIPLKYNHVDDPARRFGIDFLEQELTEFSIVTVPANAEALVDAQRAAPDVEGASVEIARRRLALLKSV